eukprot:1757492-Alexandrium_andersonii.AAC.1
MPKLSPPPLLRLERFERLAPQVLRGLRLRRRRLQRRISSADLLLQLVQQSRRGRGLRRQV